MQGRDTKPGAKKTSKTVLRKFPRKSDISPKGSVTVPFGEMIFRIEAALSIVLSVSDGFCEQAETAPKAIRKESSSAVFYGS